MPVYTCVVTFSSSPHSTLTLDATEYSAYGMVYSVPEELHPRGSLSPSFSLPCSSLGRLKTITINEQFEENVSLTA